jgi:periplasmic copper chaperone A
MRSIILLSVALLPVAARAHVSITSPVAFANTTQEVTFGVGHGCEGSDTYAIRISIPAGVTSVRPLSSDFGRVTVEKDATGAVTAVTYQRDAAQVVLDGDPNYYKLTLRLKLPNKPFTTVYFPTKQTCLASDGGMPFTDWTNTSGLTPDAGEPEPAPVVALVPARRPGWNKFTVPATGIPSLAQYFGDALIVWKGSEAFSTNPVTAEQIASTSGVSTLSTVSAGDELWVRY